MGALRAESGSYLLAGHTRRSSCNYFNDQGFDHSLCLCNAPVLRGRFIFILYIIENYGPVYKYKSQFTVKSPTPNLPTQINHY